MNGQIIGQINNLRIIDNTFSNVHFPRFVLTCGEEGSGKKTLLKHMSEVISTKVFKNFSMISSETSVDEVRNIRESIDTTVYPTMVCFYNCDTMSIQAQNSLLKMVEEPQNPNMLIAMCFNEFDSIMETLLSRAFVIMTEPYKSAEIYQYCHEVLELDEEYSTKLSCICSCPGDVNFLSQRAAFSEYMSFSESLIDHIPFVDPANAFKPMYKTNVYKSGEYRFDIALRTMIYVCMNRLTTKTLLDFSTDYYNKVIHCACEAISKYSIPYLNKQMLADSFIFNVRRAVNDQHGT